MFGKKKLTDEEKAKKKKYKYSLKQQYQDLLFERSYVAERYSKMMAEEETAEGKALIVKLYVYKKKEIEEQLKTTMELLEAEARIRGEVTRTTGNLLLGGAEAGLAGYIGHQGVKIEDRNEIPRNKMSQSNFKTILGILGKKRV